jgi:hypothetical protein
VFFGSLLASALIVGIVMLKFPKIISARIIKRIFCRTASWAVRWGVVIGKNILGVSLIIAGIVLIVAGPGQGILTILIGLIMIDIPGKRPLEAKIIQRPTVLRRSTICALVIINRRS